MYDVHIHTIFYTFKWWSIQFILIMYNIKFIIYEWKQNDKKLLN